MHQAQIPYADQPIATPDEDRFGINPFASALASSIAGMKSPNGTVIALNGPWGSGKSSAVNLIRTHLKPAIEAGELVIINFDCWWFRGEDALALAFFRELYAGIAPTVGEKVKSSLPKLGTRILKAGSALGGIADLLGAAGAGAVVGNAAEWIGNQIAQDESVEKLHGEVKSALASQPKRFLVIIDDIDRLSPEEALMMFRLVKSIGRLPNVMYLLVYDRTLAEKIVSERYPSEGAHYLEKIVQAAFELPEPDPIELNGHLLDQIGAICGEVDDEKVVHVMNLFHEGIAPWMRTPRDVARYVNAISVTWPAVGQEVDMGDFLAMEALRLHYPHTYRAVRQSKGPLTGNTHAFGQRDEQLANDLDRGLLGDVSEPARTRLKNFLMRVFPLLEGIWGGVNYDTGFFRQWRSERRVCSESHFDTYFRFSVGADIARKAEIDELVQRAAERDFIMRTFQQAVKTPRRNGGTRAAVLLEELKGHATEVADDHVAPLLSTLFSAMDQIDVEEDVARGFGRADNELRLHWLLRALTKERFSLEQRSAIFVDACQGASLGWLADFSTSAWMDYHPREGKSPEPPENCLTTLQDAVTIRELLAARLGQAAQDGSLAQSRSLSFLLYRWNEFQDDGGATVKAWTKALMASDDGVAQLASAFTSFSWSHGHGFAGLGDLVSKRTAHARVKAMDAMLDVHEFRTRVEEVSAKGGYDTVTAFLTAWRRSEDAVGDFD